MSVRFPVLSKYETQSNKGLSFLTNLDLLFLNNEVYFLFARLAYT